MKGFALVPAPAKVNRTKGTYAVPAALETELSGYTVGADSPPGINASVDAGSIKGEQSYRLVVSPNDLTLTAGGEQGLFYGFMTLRQLVRQVDPLCPYRGLAGVPHSGGDARYQP